MDEFTRRLAVAGRRPENTPMQTRCVDFNIHGLIGIRLVDPPLCAEAAIVRLLGPLQFTLLREPDITIRFVDRLPARNFRVLGPNHYAFTGDAFYVFETGRGGAKVLVPFDHLGKPCEMICERGVSEIPLLMDVVRFLALVKGCAPIHASAFVYQGQSILLSSWGKSGKTTALLGYLSLGAEFVADDCVLLRPDSSEMYGIPTVLDVSPRHLTVLPSLLKKIRFPQRLWMSTMACLRKSQNLSISKVSGTPSAARAWQRVWTAIDRRCSLQISPSEALGGHLQFRAPAPDKVFTLMIHECPEVQVEPCPLSDVVPRLAAATLEEQKKLADAYLAFKFAFPNKANVAIEQSKEQLADILSSSLKGTCTYVVRHPYPVKFRDLYEVMRPYCERPTKIRRAS